MKKQKGTYREVRGTLTRTQEMHYSKDFRRADNAYQKD